MGATLEFDRITFGLPVETFRVEAHIALEERLPVVTEFILRLLKLCDRMPLHELRRYFGFTDAEALAVVESLARQGLIDVSGDEVQLSAFALERFQETGGEYPRFTKVELKNDTVTFDLVTFSPLRAFGGDLHSDNILKIEAPEENLGDSIERARAAYRNRYPEIAATRADLKERSFGVYSVEDVESKRRGYVPIPMTFALDDDGDVERRLDEGFERSASPQLINFVHEQVSAIVGRTVAGTPGLEEFIETFDLKLMAQYLSGGSFELLSYLADVHLAQNIKYPRGVTPIVGNLYLPENREKVVRRIRARREGRQKRGKLLTSIAWLVPDNSLWGRGQAFAQTVTEFSDALQEGPNAEDLFIFAGAEQGQEQQTTSRFRVPKLRELHFINPALPMSGRLELMLYPTGFMAALTHLSISGFGGLQLPIGFISTLPKHLDTAQKVLRKAASGRNYTRRARFMQRDEASSPTSFEEACAFLCYSPISSSQDQGDPED